MHKDDFEIYTGYLGDSLWTTACMAVFSPILAVVLCFLVRQHILWLILVILFALITPLAIVNLIKEAKLLKQIKFLEQSGINETYEVELRCPKISFLTVSKIRMRGIGRTARAYTIYFGIVLKDASGRRYHYLFKSGMRLNRGDLARLKEKFCREIRVQCYKSTQIVKTIENDPYFTNVKFGVYHD